MAPNSPRIVYPLTKHQNAKHFCRMLRWDVPRKHTDRKGTAGIPTPLIDAEAKTMLGRQAVLALRARHIFGEADSGEHRKRIQVREIPEIRNPSMAKAKA